MPFRYRFAAAAWQTWLTMPRQRIMNPFRCRCMFSTCASAAGPFLDANRLQAGIYEAEGSPSQTLSRVPPCVLTLFKEDIRLTVSIRSHGIIPNLSAQGEKSFLRKTLKKLFVVPSGNLALREPI
ncbi:hypothetical protein [Paenibacillus alginolyticus]|uniref:Uncharacterized protein n=1 Tax=Paenibacillus alginolyticus TaxID=59839 RepID=A0ABT4GCL4_9BACL|nr:hypothetical protein [Paenibacillus alginolyticus]MCY9693932.1 hypothetical protein [Paenibacillus alginolyticus]MEC0146853.1 hypothetical protein [Paenibacillus alginolyticus]